MSEQAMRTANGFGTNQGGSEGRTGAQWPICAVVRSATTELTPLRSGDPAFNAWIGSLPFLPALCGGGGARLVDRTGRHGVLIAGILAPNAPESVIGLVHLGSGRHRRTLRDGRRHW